MHVSVHSNIDHLRSKVSRTYLVVRLFLPPSMLECLDLFFLVVNALVDVLQLLVHLSKLVQQTLVTLVATLLQTVGRLTGCRECLLHDPALSLLHRRAMDLALY